MTSMSPQLKWYYKNKEKHLRDGQSWREANKAKANEISRRAGYRKYHGMTLEEYEDYVSAPCAICGITDQKMHIDHDHSCCPTKHSCSKCRRGVLCPSCNRGIGLLKDDPDLLRAAADYLDRKSTPNS